MFRTGTQPYVYHGLTSSKVFLGPFADPQRTRAPKLRESVLRKPPYRSPSG